jgi:hypothetical protein
MFPSILSKRNCSLFAALSLGLVSLQAAPIEVASYTFSKAPGTSYPDPNFQKLTDGQVVPNTWVAQGGTTPVGPAVGWLENPANPDRPNPAITFYFGDAKYVDRANINYVIWPGAGVRAPHEVRVSYSFDGVTFLPAGTFTGFDGTDHPEGFTIFTRNLELNLQGIPARYVRLDIRQGPGSNWGPNRSAWHFIDEVSFQGQAIADVNKPASASIFQAVELEFPTEVGRVYRIQRSSDLVTWDDYGDLVLGNGEVYRLFSPARATNRGFFRVLQND